MNKFLAVINVIFIGFLAIAIVILGQEQQKMKEINVKYETKIRDLDRSINFVIMTDFGKDEQGMKLWTQLSKEGKIDKFFSWKANAK